MRSPKAGFERRVALLLVTATLAAPAQAQDVGPPAIAAPQSESVVTRRDLTRRNVQSLQQALAYTPESSIDVSGFDPLGAGVDIRGFPVTYTSIYRDGLRQSAVDLAIPIVEPYGADDVSVLRTPGAGVFSGGSPGGIVNVTSKRPAFDPAGEVQLQLGNFSRTQGNFDLTGPIEGSDGRLAYRMTGLVRQADTFLPGGADDRIALAPALTWNPDADTTLTVLGEYLHARLPANNFFYRFPGYGVARAYQGDPAFDGLRQDQARIGYLFEHRVSPDLIVRQATRYADTAVDFAALFRLSPIQPTQISATRRAFRSREDLAAFAIDNQVELHGQTGPVAHVLLAGLTDNAFGFARRFSFDPTDGVPPFNLATRDYGQPVVPPPLERRLDQDQNQLGIYLQDEAKWGSFVLSLNGRQDWVSTRTDYRVLPRAVGTDFRRRTHQEDSAFSYRVGLSYLLSPDIVPYASYATFFTPQPGADPNGRPFDSSRGDQIEAGVKFAVPSANITGSISGFDITQSSDSVRDLSTLFFQFAVGSVEARGFEMETTANLAPGTSLTLAYRHLDFRFTQQSATVAVFPAGEASRSVTTVSLDGNTPAGIPGDTASAFATYLFPTSSPLSGLSLGGGIRFTGASFADDLNTARNPTVTLFDAVIAYDLAALDPRYKGFRAQVNGFNVFNRDYTQCQNVFCFRGTPATVIGSLAYRW